MKPPPTFMQAGYTAVIIRLPERFEDGCIVCVGAKNNDETVPMIPMELKRGVWEPVTKESEWYSPTLVTTFGLTPLVSIARKLAQQSHQQAIAHDQAQALMGHETQ